MRQDVSLNDAKLEPLWDLVQRLQVPIFWFIDDRTVNRVEMFMRRIAELDTWAQRYPHINTIATHGLVPAAIIHDIGIPDAVIDLLRHANVFGELLFPAKFADYPYPEGQAMLPAPRDQVGAEKLAWGPASPSRRTVWCPPPVRREIGPVGRGGGHQRYVPAMVITGNQLWHPGAAAPGGA